MAIAAFEIGRSNRLQACFNLTSPRFQERRKRQVLSERFHRLISGESRLVSRELEQNPVGLAEVEAAEIESVNGPARRHVELPQAEIPLVVFGKGRDTERDVMYAAGAV